MMKKAMFIIILNIVSLCCMAQQKHALIITISDYPTESGWSKINSDNDRTLLVPEFERLGFKVTTLTNEQATKLGITQSLSQLAKQVCKDDYVCIHFSCHGQQMEDDNQDEADGLDEALIPYDASLSYQEGIYEGNNHLRDDEIEKHLASIRQKLGENGSLLVTFDACHSGTADRAEEYVEDDDAPIRGTSAVFSSNPFFISPESKKVERNNTLSKPEGMSSLHIISACQPFQRNFETKKEGKYYGTLSYALYQVLKDNRTWNINCYSLIEKEVRQLSIRQIPMVESTYTF